MTGEAVTAVDLARQLNIDPKRFRGWLREKARTGHPLLRAHQHGDSWVFTPGEAEALADEFAGKGPRVTTPAGRLHGWSRPLGPRQRRQEQVP